LRDKNPNGAKATVEELLRLSIAESDGTASDVLFKLAGGVETIGKFLNEIGVNEMLSPTRKSNRARLGNAVSQLGYAERSNFPFARSA
jgi:beta-lactamase class A